MKLLVIEDDDGERALMLVPSLYDDDYVLCQADAYGFYRPRIAEEACLDRDVEVETYVLFRERS